MNQISIVCKTIFAWNYDQQFGKFDGAHFPKFSKFEGKSTKK